MKKILFLLPVIILLAASCKKNNSIADDSPAEIQRENGFASLPYGVQQSILNDNKMEDHTDWEWERNKDNVMPDAPAIAYIDRRYIGNPLPAQISNSCQSHAASYAHNAWWQKKNDANPSFAAGTNGRPRNWQRSPYFIYYYQPYLNYWTAYTGLNVLKNMGCTHYGVMPGAPSLYSFFPDAQFGINNWQNMLDVSKQLKITSWSFVSGSNNAPTPAMPATIANVSFFLNHDQIKNAIRNNRPVMVRFALVNGGANSGLPVVTNYPGRSNEPVFRYENQSNNSLSKWHVVLIVGYDDLTQTYYCQNSWGQNANGMNSMGGFYMTYSTLYWRGDQATYIND